MFRLFASDLDGTLLNERHECDEKISNGIRTLLKNDKYFVVATGRNQYDIDFGDLKKDVYICCLNGAQIIAPGNKIIYESQMDNDLVLEFANAFPYRNVEYICREGSIRICTPEEFEIDRKIEFEEFLPPDVDPSIFSKGPKIPRIFIQSKEELKKYDILKMNWFTKDSEKLKCVQEFVEAHPPLINAPFQEDFVEITNDTDKSRAVQWLCNELDILKDEVAVYGDGFNDLTLLRDFPYSYSPCGSPKKVKEKAHYIIGPFEEYSVIEDMLKKIK